MAKDVDSLFIGLFRERRRRMALEAMHGALEDAVCEADEAAADRLAAIEVALCDLDIKEGF